MSTKSDYELLIEFIMAGLQQKEDDGRELCKISEETSRRMYGFRFSTFVDFETREKFIQDLVDEIKNVDNYLESVAGRHQERHKELVSLLVEQFDIESELDKFEPHSSGGYLHEQCARERLEAVKKRIEEIISEKDAEA